MFISEEAFSNAERAERCAAFLNGRFEFRFGIDSDLNGGWNIISHDEEKMTRDRETYYKIEFFITGFYEGIENAQ